MITIIRNSTKRWSVKSFLRSSINGKQNIIMNNKDNPIMPMADYERLEKLSMIRIRNQSEREQLMKDIYDMQTLIEITKDVDTSSIEPLRNLLENDEKPVQSVKDALNHKPNVSAASPGLHSVKY